MTKPLINPYLVVATVLSAVFIVYGSLYPFEFHARSGEALATLLTTWHFRLEHAGNLIGNVLFYAPLGLFAVLALHARVNALARLSLALLIGTALCFSMELLQFYVDGRVSTFADIYPNMLGSVLGGCVGLVVGANRQATRALGAHAEPIPLLLAGAFIAYRLFPYVPSLDLHQYWRALKPVLFDPQLHVFGVTRYAVTWLVVAALGRALVGAPRSWPLLALAVACVLAAKIAIVNNSVSADELVGAAAALTLWLALNRVSIRPQSLLLATALGLLVVAERLQPFDFGAGTQAFGWLPFRSWLHGSMGLNAQSILEKFFLYGSLIWLLRRAGSGLAFAGISVALALLATSILQTHLPGRSAELTDAVMALLISAAFALMPRTIGAPEPVDRPLSPQSPWRAYRREYRN
ncbi:VanZ family protein [Salinisphaera aquimarina]|uniref:VanZ family protein n=1 Tax=Salinisphaera aquimarina TaxID=2094031 RepID=A0ABV7ERB3_9GAMM